MVDNPFAMRRTTVTIGQLLLAPGLRVLDAGCGPGRLTIPIARAVTSQGSVLAVDIQGDMIRRTKEKAVREGLTHIEFLKAGLGEGMLPESQFDRGVLSTVLGEIPDRRAALGEIFRSLKPGGFLLVNEVVGDPHYQSQAKVRALAEGVGFRPGKSFGTWLAYSIVLEKPVGS